MILYTLSLQRFNGHLGLLANPLLLLLRQVALNVEVLRDLIIRHVEHIARSLRTHELQKWLHIHPVCGLD